MKKKDKVHFELADIVRRFSPGLLDGKLSAVQYKALHNIKYCRTSVMGGHEEECDHCHQHRYSYNSCRDRHCLHPVGFTREYFIYNLL
ncbi:MAG: transposase zinc-binding domain-containing protein [Cyclobacteriaceae bacterium]|nr:transposase zinc-binding domain-containing protein [Cyclobacteriaceae bacterium]